MKALISGASKGVGRAIAIRLNQLNFDLILIARGKPALEELKNKLLLERPNADIQIHFADLSEQNDIKTLTSSINNQFPEVIVNNLGNFTLDLASEISPNTLMSSLETNLFPAIDLTKLFLPKMKAERKGHIFNICSVASIVALKHAASYSISKAALKSWNDALREELREKGIKVTAIYPGSINTSSWEGTTADTTKMIQAEDIVHLVEACLKSSTNANCDEIHISPLEPI